MVSNLLWCKRLGSRCAFLDLSSRRLCRGEGGLCLDKRKFKEGPSELRSAALADAACSRWGPLSPGRHRCWPAWGAHRVGPTGPRFSGAWVDGASLLIPSYKVINDKQTREGEGD